MLSESERNLNECESTALTEIEQCLLVAYRRAKRQLLPLEHDTLVQLAVERAGGALRELPFGFDSLTKRGWLLRDEVTRRYSLSDDGARVARALEANAAQARFGETLTTHEYGRRAPTEYAYRPTELVRKRSRCGSRLRGWNASGVHFRSNRCASDRYRLFEGGD